MVIAQQQGIFVSFLKLAKEFVGAVAEALGGVHGDSRHEKRQHQCPSSGFAPSVPLIGLVP